MMIKKRLRQLKQLPGEFGAFEIDNMLESHRHIHKKINFLFDEFFKVTKNKIKTW